MRTEVSKHSVDRDNMTGPHDLSSNVTASQAAKYKTGALDTPVLGSGQDSKKSACKGVGYSVLSSKFSPAGLWMIHR